MKEFDEFIENCDSHECSSRDRERETETQRQSAMEIVCLPWLGCSNKIISTL